ncbi:hypothetical protein [Marinobacterium aestuariivivens]|uniref:Quercetin 2,3-dioxygenase C-terminal cupin domain-containing protein n=1 Tax=Marinobacterium aestuariivivens TaxID=1698799 RepID=A0ABW2A399_9GAMM
MASPSGAQGSLHVRQDVYLYQLLLAPGQTLGQTLETGRRQYVHLVEGDIEVNGTSLNAGDGVRLDELVELDLRAGMRGHGGCCSTCPKRFDRIQARFSSPLPPAF